MSSQSRWNDTALNLTAEVNRSGASPPVSVAANPLLELLFADVQGRLPPPIRQKLADAPSPAEFLDWFGAALLWRVLPPGVDRAKLLGEAVGGPEQVATAWARAVASRSEERAADEQFAAEVCCLLFRFGLVALLLAARCGLVYLAAPPESLCLTAWWLGAIVYLPLAATTGHGWWPLAATGLCLVDVAAPAWVERLRTTVFRLASWPVPAHQRLDAFYFAWRAQAVALAGFCLLRFAGR